MRITIETEDGVKPAMATAPAAITTSAETASEAAIDAGAAPGMSGATAEGGQENDGGGPPQGLLDAIAAAEAVGLTATTMPANEDVADGGAGPSAA